LALQDDFKGFVTDTLDMAFADKNLDVAALVAARELAREAVVAKCGENVNIRRLTRVDGDVVGAYLHGNRIGVVVALTGGDADLAKDVAMHVAASNPQFLDPTQVSDEAIAKEKEIFLALNEEKIKGKPDNIVANMIAGRIKKFLAESSLVEQPFIKNPEVTVGKLVQQAGATVVSFVRFEVGEGIDRGEVDFAAEVAAQLAAAKK
jgi:elongation factor Ts